MSSIIKRLYPVTAAPEFGSPAEYDRLREDLVEAGDEEAYDLSGIRPVAHAMSYSYLLDAAYIPKAALALGCSPTVRDFVAFVVKHPAALSPVACGEAGVLMVGATSTEEGWVQVYPSGSTAERFLGQALLVYENEPEAPELARRMGEPAYALRYPGLHQSSEYMTLAGGVCADLGKFGGAAVVPTLELPAEVAEITGRLVVPSDQSTRSAIAAAVLSAQDLWRKDKDGLPEGQCYLACFRPGVRAAVLEVLKNSPTVYHFFLLYAMGYKRGWLVDASWNLRVLAKGMLHLERGVLVRGMLPYDGLSMAWLGTVGHGDRACQLLNPFSELCGSCSSHSKTPWAGKIRECGCGSSGSAKDLLAHKDVMKAASTIEFDAVMAIRVTQDGRAVFTHKGPVDEIEQGVSGFARVCNDMTKLGKVPVGVTTYVYLVAKDPELILPPKVRCYVAGAWVSTDRPTSILGSGSLLVGFSDVREHTLLPYKSRDWDQVIRWHHMRARTDPTETDSRFYTAMVCHLVVYSALPFAGGGYGSAIPMRRVPPEGGYECGDAHIHGGSGEAKVAPYGSVISSLGPTIQVGNVALGPGVKLGIGPRIRRYSVVVHRDGWPEFDPAWMVEDGNDDYDIDGGGPSGSDGMFGSAY